MKKLMANADQTFQNTKTESSVQIVKQILYIIYKVNIQMQNFTNLFNRTKNPNNRYTKPYYSIVSQKAERVIDVAQDGPYKGTLIIWDGYNGDNQAFTIVQSGGSFLIKCRQNKGYLTVQSAADGAKIFTSAQPTQASYFNLVEASPGTKKYNIYTFCGKVLDLWQGDKHNGTQVVQWTYNGNSNQVWYLNDPKSLTSSSSGRD